METETPSPGNVKSFDDKKHREISRSRTGRITAFEVRDRRTFNFFLRAQGYLHGAFIRRSRGRLQWLDWSPARFAAKTRGDFSAKTIERQFPRFQRWCEEYDFAKVNVRGRWVVRVTPNGTVLRGVPGATIRDRLESAIRAYVAKSGRVKVDRVFCQKFAALSGLPLVAVETIWLKLKKLPDLRCRWRGEGRGRKFTAEHPARWAQICAERKTQKFETTDPQTSVRSAFLRNERFKNSRRAAAGPEESARTASASGNDGLADRGGDSPPEPGGLKHPGHAEAGARAAPGLAPLQICDRWISSRKLLAFAVWLAVARFKFAHLARERVVWRFAHARNFAYFALRYGFRAEAIEAAYLAGLQRSHDDALDRDRLPGGGYAPQREPSATVVYGWQQLRAADPRPAEARWAEFFAAPRRAKLKPKKGAAGSAAGPAPGLSTADAAAKLGELLAMASAVAEQREAPADVAPALAPRISAADAAAKMAALRALASEVEDRREVPGVPLGELAEFLRENGGLTLAEFRAQPPAWRGFIVAKAAAWLRAKQR